MHLSNACHQPAHALRYYAVYEQKISLVINITSSIRQQWISNVGNVGNVNVSQLTGLSSVVCTNTHSLSKLKFYLLS